MNTRMHKNSLEANQAIEAKKPTAKEKVLIFIRHTAPITRQEIADRLGWQINRVTGRVRELLDENKIEEVGSIRVNNRPAALLSVKRSQPVQQDLPL